MITLIAACSKNWVIGNNNQLIWNLPNDLKRFKNLTNGNPILMGRKTFESIGKPLPNRTNIIITKDLSFKNEGCLIYSDWRDVLPIFEKQNLFVIGGGEIYRQLMPVADKIELTWIDKEFEGDTTFPKISGKWTISNVEKYSNDEFNYEFRTYVRNPIK